MLLFTEFGRRVLTMAPGLTTRLVAWPLPSVILCRVASTVNIRR